MISRNLFALLQQAANHFYYALISSINLLVISLQYSAVFFTDPQSVNGFLPAIFNDVLSA